MLRIHYGVLLHWKLSQGRLLGPDEFCFPSQVWSSFKALDCCFIPQEGGMLISFSYKMHRTKQASVQMSSHRFFFPTPKTLLLFLAYFLLYPFRFCSNVQMPLSTWIFCSLPNFKNGSRCVSSFPSHPRQIIFWSPACSSELVDLVVSSLALSFFLSLSLGLARNCVTVRKREHLLG